MFKYLFYGLVALALVAVFTKPTADDIDGLLKAQTLAAVQETDVDLTDLGVEGALVSLCKLQPNACWDVISGLTTISYQDRYVFGRVGIEGPGDPRVCYAAFRQLICL